MNIVFLGLPGSGKGTQSRILQRRYNANLISTGDIFRSIAKSDDDTAKYVNELINKGELVPDDVVLDLVEQKIAGFAGSKDHLIFDGLPRTVKQAETLDGLVVRFGGSIDLVVQFLLEDKIIIDRLNSRLVCSNCGAIYSSQNEVVAGVDCFDCGSGKLSKRPDDNLEVIEHRLKLEQLRINELLEYYRPRVELYQVCAETRIDDIADKIIVKLRELSAKFID